MWHFSTDLGCFFEELARQNFGVGVVGSWLLCKNEQIIIYKRKKETFSLRQLGCKTWREFPSSLFHENNLTACVVVLKTVGLCRIRFAAASGRIKDKLVCDSICSLSLQNTTQKTLFLLLLLFLYLEFIFCPISLFCGTRETPTHKYQHHQTSASG